MSTVFEELFGFVFVEVDGEERNKLSGKIMLWFLNCLPSPNDSRNGQRRRHLLA